MKKPDNSKNVRFFILYFGSILKLSWAFRSLNFTFFFLVFN